MYKFTIEELQQIAVEEASLKKIADRYGVSRSYLTNQLKKHNIVRDPALKDKIMVNSQIKLNREKYGVDYFFQTQEHKNKVKKTSLDRYGVEHVFQSNDFKEKSKQSNLKKHGVEHHSQSETHKEKSRKTLLEKYGVSHNRQIDSIGEYFKDKTGEKDSAVAFEKFVESEFIDKPVFRDLSKATGFSYSAIVTFVNKIDKRNLVKTVSGTSSYEKEIVDLFPHVELEKTRKVIKPYEIDLYSQENNVGIEFNGNYYHCEDVNDPSSRFRHQLKSQLGENVNVFIFHIFEYEWLDPRKQSIIISQLNNLLKCCVNRVYARKCVIKEIDTKTKNEFLNENHLQGQDKASVKLGLFFDNELMSVMTFVKPRFNKNFQWELSRFASKKNTLVVGGASKLFKYFVKTHQPRDMISYSDYSKGNGGLYEKLGFSFKELSPPNYKWINQSTGDMLTRYQTQMKNEKTIMWEKGYVRLFDCGNKVWTWVNNG